MRLFFYFEFVVMFSNGGDMQTIKVEKEILFRALALAEKTPSRRAGIDIRIGRGGDGELRQHFDIGEQVLLRADDMVRLATIWSMEAIGNRKQHSINIRLLQKGVMICVAISN